MDKPSEFIDHCPGFSNLENANLKPTDQFFTMLTSDLNLNLKLGDSVNV